MGSHSITAHSALLYRETIDAQDDGRTLSSGFEDFLITELETSHGWTVTREQYEFAE